MDEVVMTIGTDMELSSGDQNLGKIEERIVSWGKTFEYMGPNGTKLASGKQRVVSLEKRDLPYTYTDCDELVDSFLNI